MAMPTVERSVDDAQRVRRRVLGIALAIFFVTFAVYGGTANRESASLDTHAASAEAWSIAVLGTPWLEDADQDSFDKNPFLSEAANGHVVAKRTAGPVLLAIPVYWVAGQLGVDDFDLWPGGLAAAGATALAVTC